MASKEGLLEAGTNAQNLPKLARRFVVPRDGYTFLYPDFAQIEARAMAVLSGDRNLRKALYEPVPSLGKPDYHTWLANAISEYDPKIVLSRDQSKRVSYAGFYGVRPAQLAKELTAEAFRKKAGMNVDSVMAQRIIDTLYRVCPEVPRWQQSAVDEVLRTRRLVSPTGREFPFVGYIVDKKDKGELDYEIKKQIWSRLPQDMGSWILGLGIIDMYYTSNEWGKLLTPLIPVHDSVLIECPRKEVTKAEALASKLLTRYIWDMDFPIDMKRGNNWYEASQ
jgi:DNA polymerase I-like protein with 3'-5' exonuclease and polymerase domains